MDSLSSAPGNRNSTKNLLSAVFAIAASISGSVNAATTPAPKFTDEPAGSPKILDVAKAQQAILDMLPADHKSRPGIAAAIKSLEDGGSVQELTNLFIWAKTIVDSPTAPPAAKEKAKVIIDTLSLPENDTNTDTTKWTNEGSNNSTRKTYPPLNESPDAKKLRLAEEKKAKEQADILKRKPWMIKSFNEDILKNWWTSMPPNWTNTGKVDIAYKAKTVTITLQNKKWHGSAQRGVMVPSWNYTVILELAGDQKIVFWIKKPDGTDDRKELWTWTHDLWSIESMRVGVNLDELKPTTTISSFTLIDNDVNGNVAGK